MKRGEKFQVANKEKRSWDKTADINSFASIIIVSVVEAKRNFPFNPPKFAGIN